jgi:hypothetical protein
MTHTFGKACRVAETSTVATPAPVIQSDPRRSLRTRTLLKGKLSFGRGAFTVDCTIRDISGTGARVRVQPGAAVPAQVFLVHLRDRTAFEATVKWRRKDGQLGLKLDAAHDLNHCRTPELKQLRRYCIDAATVGLPTFFD